jgi:competence protein ComEA
MVAAIVFSTPCGAQSDYANTNLAAKLAEGSLIVNVNTGTFDELVTIPGIGDDLASAIFQYRPYKTVDDLKRVPGIGDKKLEQIRPHVKVTGPTERRKRT